MYLNRALEMVERFPEYSVVMYGIGTPPEGCPVEVYGCCSQMAVFKRCAEKPLPEQEIFQVST